MKFTTTTLATALLASTASAQSTTSPATLLNQLSKLLSSSCQATLGTLLAGNSSLSQCINVPALAPILANNQSSVVPNINAYLQTLCGSPACDPSVITNATQSILTGCARDLSSFGISNSTVEIIGGAYATAREVACLSTNSSLILDPNTQANQTVYYNATTMNYTLPYPTANPNTTYCPTALLTELENYLGTDLTNSYIDTLLLGGNSAAYNKIIGIFSNASVLTGFACNDCVAGSVDIILENYPALANQTFSIPAGTIANLTGMNVTGSQNLTIESIYEGLCMIPIGANESLPSSLNETAYNTTLPIYANVTSPINSTMPTPSPLAARGIKIAREY